MIGILPFREMSPENYLLVIRFELDQMLRRGVDIGELEFLCGLMPDGIESHSHEAKTKSKRVV